MRVRRWSLGGAAANKGVHGTCTQAVGAPRRVWPSASELEVPHQETTFAQGIVAWARVRQKNFPDKDNTPQITDTNWKVFKIRPTPLILTNRELRNLRNHELLRSS